MTTTTSSTHRRRIVLLGLAVLGTTIAIGCTPVPVLPIRITPATTPPVSVAPPTSTGTTRADGSRLLYTPPTRESAQNPAFSPDGKSLLITRFHQGYNVGPAGVHLVSVVGGASQPSRALVDDAGHDAVNLPGSAWNRITNRVVLASDRGGHPGIWSMDPDGSAAREVVAATGTVTDVLEPSFSPDGQWIAYEARINGVDRGSVWVVRSDGSQARQITAVNTQNDDRQPNWSPASDNILVQRNTFGTDTWDLFVVSVDGTRQERITTSGTATDASWSPDGSRIAFSSTSPGNDVPSICTANVATHAVTRLTNDATHGNGAPSWSPDGQVIAFESFAGPTESAASIWTIAAPA